MKYLRILLLVAGIALIGGSAFFLVKNHMRAAEAHGWPRAQARIVASEVRTLHRTEVGNEGDFMPAVRFDYVVNGRTFHGDTIWLDERRSFGSQNVAARELAFLEVGTETEVLYNPANPREAALIVEERAWPNIFLLVLGVMLAGIGWGLWRMRPPPKPMPQAQPQPQPQPQPQGQMQMPPQMQKPPQAQMPGQGQAQPQMQFSIGAAAPRPEATPQG